MTVSLKVTGTRVCHAISVTRFMQLMPLLAFLKPFPLHAELHLQLHNAAKRCKYQWREL